MGKCEICILLWWGLCENRNMRDWMSETCRKLVGNLSETLKERKEQDALNGWLGYGVSLP